MKMLYMNRWMNLGGKPALVGNRKEKDLLLHYAEFSAVRT